MAVLKIVPKLYQEKISEKLKEEISLVTNGEAKYYNRLYKFFQYTDIQCTADINYETRKMYMDSLEKEDISEKYKAELLSLFDRLKIENMPDVYSQGTPFSVEQEFFKQEEYQAAKQVRAYEYLQMHQPGRLKKTRTRNEWQLQDHDSFKINEITSKWHWKSRDIGGMSALRFLMQVDGMEYTIRL